MGLSPRTSTTSTSPGLKLRSLRRREISSRPRRRPTSPLSRGRLIRLQLTLRSWLPSRATLTARPEAVPEGHLLPLQGRVPSQDVLLDVPTTLCIDAVAGSRKRNYKLNKSLFQKK